MELVRQKNVATYIFFPLVDAAGAIVSASANPDSETDTFADGTAPNGFADCTNEATEIGTDGVYYLLLTQAEMNFDYIMVQIKSDDALTQFILIRTIAGDPALQATTAATDAIKTDTAAILIDTDTMEADLKTHMDTMKTNLDTNIDATETKVDTAITDIAGVKTDTAAILIDTDTMEADLTTEIDANETKIDTLQSDITAIKAITDVIPNAGALTDLKTDTAAILIDTDTMEADLKTHIDTAETNLTTEIDANETKLDTIITDTGTTLDGLIKEIGGLCNKHAYLDTTVHDGDGNMTSGRLRIYDSAANATTHGATGLLYTLTITATYTSTNLTTYLSTLA